MANDIRCHKSWGKFKENRVKGMVVFACVGNGYHRKMGFVVSIRVCPAEKRSHRERQYYEQRHVGINVHGLL